MLILACSALNCLRVGIRSGGRGRVRCGIRGREEGDLDREHLLIVAALK